jgi:hypothetical protein
MDCMIGAGELGQSWNITHHSYELGLNLGAKIWCIVKISSPL